VVQFAGSIPLELTPQHLTCNSIIIQISVGTNIMRTCIYEFYSISRSSKNHPQCSLLPGNKEDNRTQVHRYDVTGPISFIWRLPNQGIFTPSPLAGKVGVLEIGQGDVPEVVYCLEYAVKIVI